MSNKILIPILMVFVFVIMSSVGFANYFHAYTNNSIVYGDNLTVQGYVYTDAGVGVNNSLVSIVFDSNTNTTRTDSTGYFTTKLLGATINGQRNVSVTAASMTKTLYSFVTNITNGTVTFISKKPPFAAGARFTVNITMRNASNNLLTNYAPLIEVFSANGGYDPNWTIVNLTSSSTYSYGNITYNITSPSTADGNYVVLIDHGKIYKIFSVRSGYVVALSTEDNSGATKANFYPGSAVTIIAKVRDSDGNPITASGVTAIVEKPDKTTTSYALAIDDTRDGWYNTTFTTESSAGDYRISVYADISGNSIESSTLISTSALNVNLKKEEEFFFEWGGNAAFSAGGDAALAVVVTNMSDGSVISGALTGLANKVNCTGGASVLGGLNVTGAWNAVTGEAVSLGTVTYTTGTDKMTTVCKIQFTAPSTSGYYKVAVNVSVGDIADGTINGTGVGYFSSQKYMLKALPVSDLGGMMEFMTMLYPGDNATFQISAYNLSSGAEVGGSDIANITVVKITPLEFFSGTSEITNITYTATTGSSPKVEVVTPENMTGPFLIEIRADVGGESVSGTAFYMAKYIMGFVTPMGSGEGGGMDGGFGGSSSCTGTETFSGGVFSIKGTQSAAQGAEFNAILDARNEITGKNMVNCLSMTSNSSGTNGNIRFPVTFTSSASCSFSGMYFVLFNVSYQGKQDAIPSGFDCKTYNFWAQTDNWRKAPESPVTITVTGITKMSDNTQPTTGNISVLRVMNFDPGSGGNVLSNNGTLKFEYKNYSGTIMSNFTLTPNNFTNTVNNKWPDGFIDITLQYCNTDGSCDTSWSGFQVSPFDLWIESIDVGSGSSYNIWGSTAIANTNISVIINAMTNVTSMAADSNFGNITAKLGRPWGGQLSTVTVKNATLIEDNWNDTGDTATWGSESWNVTVEIPATATKGQNMLQLKVKNYQNETATTDVWFTIGVYTVRVGSTSYMNMNFTSTDISGTWAQLETALADESYMGTDKAWNLSKLNTTYGVEPKSRVCVYHGLSLDSGVVDYNIEVLVTDNATSGVFDTVVLNHTDTDNITVLRETQNMSDLYLWQIKGCNYVKWVNSTSSTSDLYWMGQQQTKKQFTIPYIVTRISQPVVGANVSVGGVAKQRDTGSGMGMGFESKLVNGTDYITSGAVTDSRGVAFATLNISETGKFITFWNVENGAVTDSATFESGTGVEVRAYSASGSFVNTLKGGRPNIVVTLTNGTADENGTYMNYTNPAIANRVVYFGTIVEESDDDFVMWDGSTDTYYVLFVNSTNLTIIDDDTDFNTTAFNYDSVGVGEKGTQPEGSAFLNGSISFAGANYAVGAIRGDDNETNMSIYMTSNNPWNMWATNSTVLASVQVCANEFQPSNAKLEGSLFNITVQTWSGSGQLSASGVIYDPINNSVISHGVIGPYGCTAVNVGPPTAWGGWKEGTNELKANVYRGNDKEQTWAGVVDYWTS